MELIKNWSNSTKTNTKYIRLLLTSLGISLFVELHAGRMILKRSVYKPLLCAIVVVILWSSNYNISMAIVSIQQGVLSIQPTAQIAGKITPFQRACHNPSATNVSQVIADPVIDLPETFYLEQTRNCGAFRESREYSNETGTPEEKDFPLAYSIVMYTDVDRAERLLRAIYQPQNFYCIHVDKRAGRVIHEAMHAIASCFPNVFTVEPPIKVFWGRISVLTAELMCMKALWKYQWKYFINLTGQEFPLKTNWELVQIFRTYNGANDVDGTSETKYVFFLPLSPAP